MHGSTPNLAGKPAPPSREAEIAAVERIKQFVRAMRPGQCRAVSEGDNCICPLCDVDRLLAQLQQAREALTAIYDLTATSIDSVIEAAHQISATVLHLEPK